MKKEDGHEIKGTYILTCDLGSKIKALRYLDLKTPGKKDKFYKELQNGLASQIKKALQGINMRIIEMDDLAVEILSKAFKRSVARSAVVVSSCTEITAAGRGYTLEINRIVDIQGNIVGIGARPGYPSIEEQVKGLFHILSRRPVILVEDGSFTGNTMANVVKKMRENNIQVAAIILGFAFPKALEVIRKEYEGEIVVVEEVKDIIDWMPDHDFIPFTPNCGRVFGNSMNGTAYPFYTHDGASYGIPYVMPFLSSDIMTKWTSIPKQAVEAVSKFSLECAKELFEILESLNGKRDIVIGDLIGRNPAQITIPVAIGQHKFPQQLQRKVTDFLASTYKHGILFLDPDDAL